MPAFIWSAEERRGNREGPGLGARAGGALPLSQGTAGALDPAGLVFGTQPTGDPVCETQGVRNQRISVPCYGGGAFRAERHMGAGLSKLKHMGAGLSKLRDNWGAGLSRLGRGCQG